MINFEIKNIFSGEVKFIAQIDCDESVSNLIKIGLCVEWAIKNNQNIRDANLSGANLSGANLRDANLSRANLNGSDLRNADLRGTDLSRANLSDADLRGTDLSRANLSDANLSRANLNGSDLRNADLRDANLGRSDLRGTDLRGADLRGANLSRADLRGADLSRANLICANLSGANLPDKDLRIFKHDFWSILLIYKNEVPDLIEYIEQGKINGSCYSGERCCLMGSLAKIKDKDIDDNSFSIKDSDSPIERWFMMISPGDTPENSFASKMALQWVKEFQSLANGS